MNKEELLIRLNELNFPIGEYYLLSSGCLMLYGLRDTINDIDICISDVLFNQIKNKYNLTEDKKNESGFYKINTWLEIVVNKKEDIIYDIKDNIPVEKLTTILKFKKQRNKEKDLNDIKNIEEYLKTRLII